LKRKKEKLKKVRATSHPSHLLLDIQDTRKGLFTLQGFLLEMLTSPEATWMGGVTERMKDMSSKKKSQFTAMVDVIWVAPILATQIQYSIVHAYSSSSKSVRLRAGGHHFESSLPFPLW
jgi:hypothetical protein